MSSDNKNRGIAAQKDALSIYFEALLREQQGDAEGYDLRPTVEAPREEVIFTPPVIAIPELHTELETAELVETTPETARPEGVPEWAAEPFQALLFKVSGLTLAVPLAELSGVQEWHDEAVTPMLGRISWYLGLMSYRERQVPVVDTAQLVLPPDRLAKLVSEDTQRLGHVVFIQEGTWGLACDSVEEVISLSQEQVKWRTSRAKRRWLAGTVLEQMCAIIDPPAFADMLRTGMADLPDAGSEENNEQ